MIEIRINKEIGNFEPKFVGPFTIRQAICVAIAAPICFVIYNFFSPLITSELAGFLCFIPAVAAYFFGWKKPYGMPTEKFIRSIFITSIVAPSHRKYKTVNHHEEVIKSLTSAYEELQNEEANAGDKNKKRKKKAKKKQPKYQPSPDAIL